MPPLSKIFAYQDEGCPIVGVGVAAADFRHRLLDCLRLILVGSKGFVEELHELRRTLVVDIPQSHQDALGSGVEESANQAEQFIAADYHVEAGAAAGQGPPWARQSQTPPGHAAARTRWPRVGGCRAKG